MKKYIKKLLPIIVGAIVVFIVGMLLTSSDEDPEQNKIIRVESEDSPGGEAAIANPKTVPKTPLERSQSSAFALLPNRASYPEREAQDYPNLEQVLEKALRAFETYSPDDPSLYKKKMEDVSHPDYLDIIVSRRDNIGPLDACPDPSCQLSSRWFEQENFSQSAFVIEKDKKSAYLVAYGAVEYYKGGQKTFSESRSYGVLMKKEGKKWLLERVAAESLI